MLAEPSHPSQPVVGCTIGELAKRTGLTPRSLRYYEEAGLLTPVGRSTGRYRQYEATTAEKRVKAIQALQSLGYSLAEIADMLGQTPAVTEGQPLAKAEQIAATRNRLRRQQGRLNDKLVLLQSVKHEVDARLTVLDAHCSPCVQALPDVPCNSHCQHHTVHDD